MQTLRIFLCTVLGSLGLMQLAEYTPPGWELNTPAELFFKTLLSLLAGTLTALASRWLKRISNNNQFFKKRKRNKH